MADAGRMTIGVDVVRDPFDAKQIEYHELSKFGDGDLHEWVIGREVAELANRLEEVNTLAAEHRARANAAEEFAHGIRAELSRAASHARLDGPDDEVVPYVPTAAERWGGADAMGAKTRG